MELFGDIPSEQTGPHPLVANTTVKSSWLGFGGVTGGDKHKHNDEDKGEEEAKEVGTRAAAAMGHRLSSLFRRTHANNNKRSAEEKKETTSTYLADLITNDGEINRKPAPVDVNATGGFLLKFNINGLDMVHTGAVNDVYFAPSECRVATAGGDKLIKLWDPRDGSFVKRLEGHHDEVGACVDTVCCVCMYVCMYACMHVCMYVCRGFVLCCRQCDCYYCATSIL